MVRIGQKRLVASGERVERPLSKSVTDCIALLTDCQVETYATSLSFICFCLILQHKGFPIMFDIITTPDKDPLGRMLLDYLAGKKDSFVEVVSPNLEMWKMTGATMFRDYQHMDALEQAALHHCRGSVLDVGAGSGCHSLWLQDKSIEVDAIEVSPGCVEVMKLRQVHNIVHQNLFSHSGRKYQTILMLMNGFGICGSIDGLNLFLQFATTLLEDGGQIIADSTDLRVLGQTSENSDADHPGYFGETQFVMHYGNTSSDPFNWLYIDFPMLQTLTDFHALSCERLQTADNGRYLARIS